MSKVLGLLILLMFVFLFYSCKIETKLYGECETNFFTCAQIVLEPNKNFEYFIFADVGGSKIYKGEWKKLNKDTFILNTYEQPRISSTYYEGEINEDREDSIRVEIRDFERALAGVLVIINDDERAVTNKDGVCYFSKQKVERIKYSFFMSNKGDLEISNENYNEIKIYLEDLKTLIPDYLTNKKFVMRKDGIIMFFNDALKYELKRVPLSDKRFGN